MISLIYCHIGLHTEIHLHTFKVGELELKLKNSCMKILEYTTYFRSEQVLFSVYKVEVPNNVIIKFTLKLTATIPETQ